MKKVNVPPSPHDMDDSSFIWHFVFYILFCAVFSLSHSILLSTVAFFHFLLGHPFQTIRDWTFRYAWEIVSLSKGFALFFVLKVVAVKWPSHPEAGKLFRQNLRFPGRRIFAILIYLLTFIIWLGRPRFLQHEIDAINFGFQGISYLGGAFFYLADFLIMAYCRFLRPLGKKRDYLFFYTLFPLTFYFTTVLTIPFVKHDDPLLFFHFFSSFLFLEFKGLSLGLALVYNFLLVGPLGAFLGLDPLWGDQFSLIRMQKELPIYICVVLWPSAYIYLFYSQKKWVYPLPPRSGESSS